jgi:hypothetical protein
MVRQQIHVVDQGLVAAGTGSIQVEHGVIRVVQLID